ncbi:hypothetical protein JTB14_021224 [Gonioctena quinquepunctata]|nr:hypothetical protein JTB14_021224 [Gonioctena quinquepunctata]
MYGHSRLWKQTLKDCALLEMPGDDSSPVIRFIKRPLSVIPRRKDSCPSKASEYDLVIIPGEAIDLLVIFTGLVGPSKNVYFQKCERGKTADVFHSAVSTSSENHHLIPSVHAFSGCDTTSAFFGHGEAKLLAALKRIPQLKKQAAAFVNPTSTPVEIAAAGETSYCHHVWWQART